MCDFMAGINKLWASLRKDNQTKNDRQENRQRKILIVPKRYFAKLKNKCGAQNPLKKTGRHRKAKRLGKINLK